MDERVPTAYNAWFEHWGKSSGYKHNTWGDLSETWGNVEGGKMDEPRQRGEDLEVQVLLHLLKSRAQSKRRRIPVSRRATWVCLQHAESSNAWSQDSSLTASGSYCRGGERIQKDPGVALTSAYHSWFDLGNFTLPPCTLIDFLV